MKRPINFRFKVFALVVICFSLLSEWSFAEGNWTQWRDGYLTQVDGIKAAALQKNDATANWTDHRKALLVGKESSEEVIKELEALAVPPELQQYHRKLIEGYKLTIQNVDAWLKGDGELAQYFGIKAVECEKGSYEELRRVAQEHGASKQDLDIIDGWISSFSK